MELGKGGWAIDEMAHEPEHCSLERSVGEGQGLGPPLANLDVLRNALACSGDHPRLRVDTHDPRARVALGDRPRQAARATAAVENAPPAEVSLCGQRLEDPVPVGVRWPHAIVVRGETTEVRLPAHDGAGRPRATTQRLNPRVRTSGSQRRGSTVCSAYP